ncbi:MAG TPA: MBL fold metallo-hydrolase [Steroidobacteraceae bacterium]|nr:MBL fold metallo-hydrolase [Steroidobacteraceae bacterium]
MRNLIIAAMLLCGSTAFAAPELKMDLPDWKTTPLLDHDLGHGVHMLESFGGNIGVLADAHGVLLVDAEWPQLNARVRAAVARISPQPVRYVVDTHWHWDHVGGNGEFARRGALLLSSRETHDYIVAAQRDAKPGDTQYFRDPAAVPSLTFGPGTQRFYFAGQTLEIFHAPPAHTNGDLVVHYVEADVLQTGDTFFHGFYPDIDIEHGGSIDGMIALYDILYEMCGPKTRVIPGHGPVANREDLRTYQAMLRTVRQRVAQGIGRGLTEEQLIASHPLADLDKVWGGNLVKQPYLLAIVYEDLKQHALPADPKP